MDRTTLYARTSLGNRELAEPADIRGDFARMLAAVDGKISVGDLAGRLPDIAPAALESGLAVLVDGGYIAIPYGAPGFIDRRKSSADGQTEHQRRADDLRAKLKARREGGPGAGQERHDEAAAGAGVPAPPAVDERVRREIEEKARREAEEKVRREFEEQARREAEARARREAEERQRREVEERARREAEERVRREMEEKARAEAQEKARQEAAERAWHEAQDKARRDAEDKARREAEDKARRAADEQARQAAAEEEAREAEERARRAEVQARLLAEEVAWQEAEEKARREEAAAREKESVTTAELHATGPRKGGGLAKALGGAAAALLVVGLAALHLVSFSGQIPAFEKALAAQLREPVKIQALHVALVPVPHLRADGITLGAGGQVKIAAAKAYGDLGNLFSATKNFSSIALDAPVVDERALGWLLLGQPGAREFAVAAIDAANVKLEGKSLAGLPPFDAHLKGSADGGWTTIVLDSADKAVEGTLTNKGRSVQLDVRARTFKLPFGIDLALEEFTAAGSASADGLDLAEFKGFTQGGTLSGTARLRWASGWSLAGEVNVKQVDMARLAPALMSAGRLAGSGTYVMQAAEPGQLYSGARIEGSFAMPRGTLTGIDLGAVLQGGDIRGQTQFTELAGNLLHERGATQLRQLRLNQANMAASGNLDIDAERRVRGRVNAEIRLSTEMRRINLGVSGNLGKLEWQRQ